jgi:hypothetical protein
MAAVQTKYDKLANSYGTRKSFRGIARPYSRTYAYFGYFGEIVVAPCEKGKGRPRSRRNYR